MSILIHYSNQRPYSSACIWLQASAQVKYAVLTLAKLYLLLMLAKQSVTTSLKSEALTVALFHHQKRHVFLAWCLSSASLHLALSDIMLELPVKINISLAESILFAHSTELIINIAPVCEPASRPRHALATWPAAIIDSRFIRPEIALVISPPTSISISGPDDDYRFYLRRGTGALIHCRPSLESNAWR